jgi:hypothetical protein
MAGGMKQKKCKSCSQPFIPVRPLQTACCVQCAIDLGRKRSEKLTAAKARKEAKENREAKVKAKTRGQWMREAQAMFNRWIRKRDELLPCVSCNRMHQGQLHAGHYQPTSTAPELRFDERNVNLQCAPCNTYRGGNLTEYRKGLIAKIGVQEVEALEGWNPPRRYTIDDLKAIKKEYADRLKDEMARE